MLSSASIDSLPSYLDELDCTTQTSASSSDDNFLNLYEDSTDSERSYDSEKNVSIEHLSPYGKHGASSGSLSSSSSSQDTHSWTNRNTPQSWGKVGQGTEQPISAPHDSVQQQRCRGNIDNKPGKSEHSRTSSGLSACLFQNSASHRMSRVRDEQTTARRKEILDEVECKVRIKAQPVPLSTMLPLYSQLKEIAEKRSLARKTSRAKVLRSNLEPFKGLEKHQAQQALARREKLHRENAPPKVPLM